MDWPALLGLAAAVGVPAIGYAIRIDRRLARLETLVELALQPRADVVPLTRKGRP